MRGVLVDENLPSKLCSLLAVQGIDAVHVAEIGLDANSDQLV